jgi:site-specific recombinase XerD
MTEQVRAFPQSLGAPRAVRSRRVPISLPAAAAEQVKTSFYAPVLSATNLAESLLRAAGTDAAHLKSAEWRATLQQAMDQIRASCAALLDISSSEAAHEAFPPILASVDELERFLRLVTPILGDMDPEAQCRQLELSSKALAQSTSALKRIYKTILNPAGRKPAAKKRPPAGAPRRRQAAPEKSVHGPGWLRTLMPGRNREKAELTHVASAPTAPLPASPSTQPSSRRMSDGLRLLSNSGQWIEQAVRHDPSVKSENTRREYIADLYVFNAWRRDRPFTRALIEDYTATLEWTGYSPDAVARMLEALRWLAGRLAEVAIENDHLDAAEQQDILISAAQAIGFKQARAAAPAQDPHIAKAELAALLYNCVQDASWLGTRDAAIVALAWSADLKPSQLASLKVTSFQCDGGEGSLNVRRGIRDETIRLPDPVTQAVLKWLSVRRYNLGPLFYAISRQGNIRWGQAMTEEAMAQVIETRMVAAQIASTVHSDN